MTILSIVPVNLVVVHYFLWLLMVYNLVPSQCCCNVLIIPLHTIWGGKTTAPPTGAFIA